MVAIGGENWRKKFYVHCFKFMDKRQDENLKKINKYYTAFCKEKQMHTLSGRMPRRRRKKYLMEKSYQFH